MAKNDTKRKKIQAQILKLETDFKSSLTKKVNGAKEINLGEYQKRMQYLQDQLRLLN